MCCPCNLPQTKPCGAFWSPIWAGLPAVVHVYQRDVWHASQRRENSYCLLLLPLYGVIHFLGAVWYISAWAQQKATGAIRPPHLAQASEGPHTSLVHHCDLQEGAALVFRGRGLFPLLTSALCNAGSVMFTTLSTLLSKWQSSGCFLLAARTCHHG